MLVNKLVIVTTIAALIINPGPVKTASEANILKVHYKIPGKELFLPAKVNRVPENNDYSNVESDYCLKRMVEGEDIAIFWHKEFGDDPTLNSNEKKRFNPSDALKEMERFYDFYVNDYMGHEAYRASVKAICQPA